MRQLPLIPCSLRLPLSTPLRFTVGPQYTARSGMAWFSTSAAHTQRTAIHKGICIVNRIDVPSIPVVSLKPSGDPATGTFAHRNVAVYEGNPGSAHLHQKASSKLFKSICIPDVWNKCSGCLCPRLKTQIETWPLTGRLARVSLHLPLLALCTEYFFTTFSLHRLCI
jgi:hypothetical protein